MTTPQPAGVPAVETYDYSLFGPVEARPLNAVRRVIGRRLHAAWANVPHVFLFDEVDLAAVEALRQRLKPRAAADGVRLTLQAFILRACARALAQVPQINASLDPSGKTLILKRYCHIAFAADTPIGLLTPVVRDVDRKSVLEVAAAVARLAGMARAGRLAFEDAEGACFTVSNLGVLGGTGFTPVINAPETAILGVARAGAKPVVADGRVVSRMLLPLCLAFDHRVVDGAEGGRFMAAIRGHLAEPESLVG